MIDLEKMESEQERRITVIFNAEDDKQLLEAAIDGIELLVEIKYLLTELLNKT